MSIILGEFIMKRTSIFIFLLLIMFVSSGCDRTTDGIRINIDIPSNTSVTPLEKNDIDWITMTGGLGGITTKVLFNGYDDVLIDKIIGMFNENSQMHKLDSSAVESILSKTRPIGLVISFKDGNKLFLWPSYKEVKYADGNSSTITTLKDGFIIQTEKEGISQYYEIFCQNIAEYLLDGWKEDMPIVNDVIVKSFSESDEFETLLNAGDEFTVSGDGCTSQLVNIYVYNKKTDIKCLIGQTKPNLGEWSWNGIIDKKIRTIDGSEIQLPAGLYDIVVDFGDREKSIYRIINIEDNSDERLTN